MITSVAALYSSTLEKSAVEFAAAYINQQSGVDPLYWLTTVNTSTIVSNETTGELILFDQLIMLIIIIKMFSLGRSVKCQWTSNSKIEN